MPKRIDFDDVDFHLDVNEPSRELLDYAREKLGETEERRVQRLDELRQLIIEKNEVTPDRTDDAFLLRFLRARNFNIRKTYDLLVNYCHFKEDNPEFHEGVNPTDLYLVGEADIISVLPYREQTGRRIMIYKLGNWIPSEVPIVELFKATLTLVELGILEQRAQILGGICIFDMKGLSLSHAWQITPSVASKVFQLMVTSFPLKVWALHIVFESWVFDIMFNMFKPFLNERMKKKIYIHGNNMESLHTHVDPKYLPKRYGGVRPRYRYKKWIEGFRSSEYIMKELISLGYVFKDTDLTTPIVDSQEELSDDDIN